MAAEETTSTNNVQSLSTSVKNQYALWQIVGIWLAAGAPMWLLGWLFFPALSAGLPALEAGLLRMKLMALGLVWQFILSMIVVHYEEGDLRLETIRRRFWLNHPVSARTRETKKAFTFPTVVRLDGRRLVAGFRTGQRQGFRRRRRAPDGQ